MKKSTLFWTILALAFFALGFSGCNATCPLKKDNAQAKDDCSKIQKDDWTRIQESGELVFGVKADAPPFGEKTDSGEYKGFDIDIARALAKHLHLNARFVTVSSSDRIPYLKENKVDVVIASMTITQSREAEVDFTNPYFQEGQALLCKKTSVVQSYRDLKSKLVGAVKGSTSYATMKKVQPDCTMKAFVGYSEAIKALLAGEVEAITSDYLILQGLIHKNEVQDQLEMRGSRFTVEPYGLALRQNQSALRDKLNEAIRGIWIEEIWHDIYRNCFSQPPYQTDIQFQILVIPD